MFHKLIRTGIAACAFLTVIFITGCSGTDRKTQSPFGSAFPIPPEITTEDGDDPYEGTRPPPVADIYWDNTLSQVGYAQNKDHKMQPSEQFVQFYRTVTKHSVGANYRPRYWMLQPNDRSFLKWTETPQLKPESRSFYTSKGTFEYGEMGPLAMIYNSDLINVHNLTVVVTDLEEQGLNVTLLADIIRDKLLKIDDYAAALIAVKLPFNGTNYRPDPANLNSMIATTYNGMKPLYAIVSGQREAVKLFIRRFSKQIEKYPIVWEKITTTQKGQHPPLDISKDITIPESAAKKDWSTFIRNKKDLRDSADKEQNRSERFITAADRIWNLQDKTRAMVNHLLLADNGELKQIDKRLGVRIFEYERVMPRKQKGNWLWRLNVNFTLPSECAVEELETEIQNYRYLTASTQNDAAGLPVWKRNDLFISRDLETIQSAQLSNPDSVQIAVLPKNAEGTLESPVVCFDIVVKIKQEIEIPQWVSEFDDASFSNPAKNQDKTLNFGNFINNLLKGEATGDVAYSNDELLRMPVVLFNMPFLGTH